MLSSLFVVIGAVLMTFSVYAELRHKVIWRTSLECYKRPAQEWVHKMTRPSKFSYYMNIFVILPALFCSGLKLIAMAIAAKEINAF